MHAYGLLPPPTPLRRALLGMVAWNLREVSAQAAVALMREALALRAAGIDARVAIVDNGSDDGAGDMIADALAAFDGPFELIRRARNEGVSAARNVLIEKALGCGADRLLLMDGDVEIVPGSVLGLERVFAEEKNEVAVVGLELCDGVPERSVTAAVCPDLRRLPRRYLRHMCGAHYGLWRLDPFAAGARFETAFGMGEPDWGREDLDMYLQLAERGLKAVAVGGVPHLHRSRRSSIRELEKARADLAANWAACSAALRAKWAGAPSHARFAKTFEAGLEEIRKAVPASAVGPPRGSVMIHWQAEAGVDAAFIMAEAERLAAAGPSVTLRISGDGPDAAAPQGVTVERCGLHSAPARNAAIARALALAADHLLFLGAGVEPPAGAFGALTAAMETQPGKVAALGLHRSGVWREEAPPPATVILPLGLLRPAEMKAPLGCMVMRVGAFEKGFRFEDRGPFAEPGEAFAEEAAALRLKEIGLAAMAAHAVPHRRRPYVHERAAVNRRRAALHAMWAENAAALSALDALERETARRRPVALKPAGPAPTGRRVLLFTITWNMRAVTMESVAALYAEAARLRRAGHAPEVMIWDSGSTDGAREAVETIAASCADVLTDLRLRPRNEGNLSARNAMIDRVLADGFDYAFHVDGDVETIPHSVAALIAMFERLPGDAATLGLHIQGSVTDRALAMKALPAIPPGRVRPTPWLPHTHYGVTPRRVFEKGLRFEDAGPFAGPGYGLGDMDFALQMIAAGMQPYHVEGVPTLHRHFRSSVRELVAQGVDVEGIWLARRAHLIEKWRDVPTIAETVLPKLLKTKPPFVRALPE